MHCLVYVLCPPGTTDIEKAVEDRLDPFSNHTPGESHWDWYQIGGRWTGTLSDYDPEKDPENVETCKLCGGTGTRTDMIVRNGCNGCKGEGKHVSWPTEWKKHAGDVSTVGTVLAKEGNAPYAIVDGAGQWVCAESWSWNGDAWDVWKDKDWPATWRECLEKYPGWIAVVCDIHD